MTVDKVIAKIIWLTFFWPTLYINSMYIFAVRFHIKSRIEDEDRLKLIKLAKK